MSLLDGLGLTPEPGTPDEAGVAPVEDGTLAAPTAPAPTPPAAPPEPDEEPITLPEGAENPDAVKALIRAERKKAKEANARARELERQAAEAAEASKPIEERIGTLEQRARDSDLRALRLEVGIPLGLSVKLSSRLTGTTAEELASDAAELIAELGNKPKPVVPGLDGGVKSTPPPTTDPTKAHDNFLLQAITAKRGA